MERGRVVLRERDGVEDERQVAVEARQSSIEKCRGEEDREGRKRREREREKPPFPLGKP